MLGVMRRRLKARFDTAIHGLLRSNVKCAIGGA
jgi:hypothetical protein